MGGALESESSRSHVQRFREEGSRRSFAREELERLGGVLEEAATSGKLEIDGKTHKVHSSVFLTIRLLALSGLRRGELLGVTSQARLRL